MSASVHLGGTLTLPGVGAHSPAAANDGANGSHSPAALWTRRDIVHFAVPSVISIVLLAVSWYFSGDGQPLDRQMHRIDLAVAALLIGTVSGGRFLLRGYRAVAARKTVVKALAEHRLATRATVISAVAPTAGGELVAGPGMTRFHRPGCSLVTGKTFAAASRAEHEQAGRRPCGLCLRAVAISETGR